MLFRLTYFFFLYGVVDAMLLCCVFSFFRSLVLLQVATLYCSWYGWWSDVLLLACLPACSFSCLSLYMSVCISFWFAVGLNDWLIEQNNPTFSYWEPTLKQFALMTNHEILYKRETRQPICCRFAPWWPFSASWPGAPEPLQNGLFDGIST